MAHQYSDIDHIAYIGNWEALHRYAQPFATRGELVDWHGNGVGTYVLTGVWEYRPFNSPERLRMASIRATIDGEEYTGKLSYEWANAVRLRRAKRTA